LTTASPAGETGDVLQRLFGKEPVAWMRDVIAASFLNRVSLFLGCWAIALGCAHLLQAVRWQWRLRKAMAHFEQFRAGREMQHPGEVLGPWLQDRTASAGARGSLRDLLEEMVSRATDPPSRFEERTQGVVDQCHRGARIARLVVSTIPLVGFIGTVVGISDAVGGVSTMFGDPHAGAANLVAQFQSALREVLKGLSVAFHTTLVALVVVIPAAFVVEGSFTLEESFLVRGRAEFLQTFWLWLGPSWRADLSALNERQGHAGAESLAASVQTLANRIDAVSSRMASVHGVVGDLGVQVSRLQGILEQLDIEDDEPREPA
ncbi:MAG: MotA/TolQ/ExbB proton channel family protein, partial [Candidatus Rokuibacteriota bacterium]